MTPTIRPTELPPGYPVEYERRLTLRDGIEALVRPVVPADASLLAWEIAHADTETLYLRFFTPSLRIDDSRLRLLTELDYRLVPMTADQLKVEADAWQGLVQAKAQQISDANVAGQATDALVLENQALLERFLKVVKAFEGKGGDAGAVETYRKYADGVAGKSASER